MKNAPLIYFLPDNDAQTTAFSPESYKKLCTATDIPTNLQRYGSATALADRLNEYAHELYCKTIVAIGKVISGENLPNLLKNLSVPVDRPAAALPNTAPIDYVRLDHRLHFFAVPDLESAQVLTVLLSRYHAIASGQLLSARAYSLSRMLRNLDTSIATAESCTGGLIVKALTDNAGASAYVKGGACTYTAASKEAILKVPSETIARRGIVSAETARAMALGAQRLYAADIALATTGVAGPGPDADGNPEGCVWTAVAINDCCSSYAYQPLENCPLLDRNAIRQGASLFLLEKLQQQLQTLAPQEHL